ncbi:hypothetical protein NDU88_010412 [Pleurodeles waltl]|uniref:Uncharacterized protein n=1 Tax=Pleurodeles waltl TaxID=8319 RepID=A0AAV7S166_PLEWA|nr:hypothetical protein NDU88_010412 [Pleurodeles waltl]
MPHPPPDPSNHRGSRGLGKEGGAKAYSRPTSEAKMPNSHRWGGGFRSYCGCPFSACCQPLPVGVPSDPEQEPGHVMCTVARFAPLKCPKLSPTVQRLGPLEPEHTHRPCLQVAQRDRDSPPRRLLSGSAGSRLLGWRAPQPRITGRVSPPCEPPLSRKVVSVNETRAH